MSRPRLATGQPPQLEAKRQAEIEAGRKDGTVTAGQQLSMAEAAHLVGTCMDMCSGQLTLCLLR
jgi:hypothetical protein